MLTDKERDEFLNGNRGKINNRARAGQLRDFSGLRFGNITPTDIDGYIEYHNICHVFIELKYKDAALPQGQRIALERLCDDVKGKPAIALIASHNNSIDEDIKVADAIVTEVRWHGHWYRRDQVQTTKECILKIFEYLNGGVHNG